MFIHVVACVFVFLLFFFCFLFVLFFVLFVCFSFFFFQAEDGIRDRDVTGVPDVCSSDLNSIVIS